LSGAAEMAAAGVDISVPITQLTVFPSSATRFGLRPQCASFHQNLLAAQPNPHKAMRPASPDPATSQKPSVKHKCHQKIIRIVDIIENDSRLR
jgi:hypothetical protein